MFSTCRQFESRLTKVVLFFLQNSTHIPSLDACIMMNVCLFLKILFMKFINWEQKGNFKRLFARKTDGWALDMHIKRIVSEICPSTYHLYLRMQIWNTYGEEVLLQLLYWVCCLSNLYTYLYLRLVRWRLVSPWNDWGMCLP